MASNIRIPPAINESFVKLAAGICDWARMDYDEWMVNSQELVYHLQERWREGIELGLNSEDAKTRALKLFGKPSAVAKSLRKPWLTRLLYYHRFRPERFYFFVLAYFFYTWLIILDTHWHDLTDKNHVTPFQILLPFGVDFFRDGLGSMLVGFAAAGCLVLAQWQPMLSSRWLNKILLVRHLLLLVTGYALFAVLIRSPYLAAVTLPAVANAFPSLTKITLPFSILHIVGILAGWFGALCLLFEIWGRTWNTIRLNIVLFGILLAIFFSFGSTTPSTKQVADPGPPPLTSTNLTIRIVGETTQGKEVLAWLEKKKWDENHRRTKRLEEKRIDKQLFIRYGFADSQETFAKVFAYNANLKTWEFNDFYLESLRGVQFDLDLSLIIHEPGKAQGFLTLRNKMDSLTEDQKKLVAVFFGSATFTQSVK